MPPPPPRSLTLNAYAVTWLKELATRRKPRTVETYSDVLERHIFPTLGMVPLDELSRRTVRDYLVAQLRHGYAGTTVRLMLAVLRALLNSARFDDEILASNPADRLGHILPPKPQRRHRALPADALGRFLAVAEMIHPRLYGLYLFMARTGLRIGEALAVEWNDLDLEKRVIYVQRGIDWRRRNSTPKSGKTRVVGLSRTLTDHLEELREARLRSGPRLALVFHSPSGRPWSRVHVWRVMRRVCRRANLSPASAHALRSTFATGLSERGVPLRMIAELMGHHSVTVTEKYLDITDGYVAAVDRLDD